MKLLLTIVFGLLSTLLYAQNPDRVLFYYDIAGNQTQRILCINCLNSKTENDNPKEIDEDLLKFSPEDIISYYPNPVREELYLKWELINDNHVNELQLFDINAKLISTISNLKNTDSTTISFFNFPKNIYFIVLVFKNGESKSIKISKE